MKTFVIAKDKNYVKALLDVEKANPLKINLK